MNEKTLKSHLKTIQLREMNKAIKRAMENAMKQRMSPVVNRSMKQNTLGAPAMPGAAATYKNLTEKYKPTIDVLSMTFYRHFGTKEAVIVDVILTGSIGQAIHREATSVPVAGTPEEVVGL